MRVYPSAPLFLLLVFLKTACELAVNYSSLVISSCVIMKIQSLDKTKDAIRKAQHVSYNIQHSLLQRVIAEDAFSLNEN